MEIAATIPVKCRAMKPIEDIDLAQLFKETREELGYDQREMAKYLGVALSAYYFWEADKRTPNGQATAKVLLIRELLGLPLRPRKKRK